MPTAFNQLTDNAVTTTSTSYSSAGATSTTVAANTGGKFPQPGNGFILTIWSGGVDSDPRLDANMEKVTVTARSGDTLTHSATINTHTAPVNVGLLNVSSDMTALQTAVNNLEVRTFDVKDYGAKGDGSTDDYTAINNAITAANNAGGGFVDLPPGTYMTSHWFNLGTVANVTIRSKGKWAATVKPIAANLSNFGFAYIFSYGSTPTTSIGITLDGLKLDGNYQPTNNVAGGIKPGSNWIVKDCWTTNFNYFPIWLDGGAVNVKIQNHRFSGQSNGADNIGGGGATYTEISGCVYESDCTGNAWDNVGGSRIYYHHNVVKGNNSVIIEAMDHIYIHDNQSLGGGNISIQSDKGYGGPSYTNSRYIEVKGNKVSGGGSIAYKADTDPVKSTTTGGDIEISGNYINAPALNGILVYGGSDGTSIWGTNYRILNNTVIDANANNSATSNNGYGVVDVSGINIAEGMDVLVANNYVHDTRGTPRQIYGIEVGQTNSPSSNNQPNHVVLFGNRLIGYVTGATNLVSATYTTDYVELSSSAAGALEVLGSNLSVNTNIGVGTTSPYAPLHVYGPNTNNNPMGIMMSRFAASNTNVRGASVFHSNDGTHELFVVALAGSNGAVNANAMSLAGARFVVDERGATGFNVTAPTAFAHPAASTTTMASLRIPSGTAPTSPNDGDIWYDGTNVKIRVGGTTKTFTIT